MKSVNSALLWRVGIIILLPFATVVVSHVFPSSTHTLYPESAAGLRFGIRLEHTTGETCLIFRSDPAPEKLKGFLCTD